MAEPIIINFARPIADRRMAEQAIHVSSIPPVSGKFYWLTPTPGALAPAQLLARPHRGARRRGAAPSRDFVTGDALMATADDATHQLTVTRNGDGGEDHSRCRWAWRPAVTRRPNGTYYVLDKKAKVVMDSSTYGVPVNSTYGYKVDGRGRRAVRQQR